MDNQKIAVVSGANRGIGKEIVQQLASINYKVVALVRKPESLNAIENTTDGLVIPHVVNIASDASCESFSSFLKENFEKIDVLINNAGIMGSKSMTDFDLDEITDVMNTNVYGAIRLTKAVLPLLKKSNDARIINVSSEMGALRSLSGGYAAYRLSKWALNGFTIMLASELHGTHIKVNSMCPGWCRTDMGGKGAPRAASQGAETAVWLATNNSIGTGKFYSDKKEIKW